jgi:hypothetical protein
MDLMTSPPEGKRQPQHGQGSPPHAMDEHDMHREVA